MLNGYARGCEIRPYVSLLHCAHVQIEQIEMNMCRENQYMSSYVINNSAEKCVEKLWFKFIVRGGECVCLCVQDAAGWGGWPLPFTPGTGECHSVVTYAQDVLRLAETFLDLCGYRKQQMVARSLPQAEPSKSFQSLEERTQTVAWFELFSHSLTLQLINKTCLQEPVPFEKLVLWRGVPTRCPATHSRVWCEACRPSSHDSVPKLCLESLRGFQ